MKENPPFLQCINRSFSGIVKQALAVERSMFEVKGIFIRWQRVNRIYDFLLKCLFEDSANRR